MSTTEIVLAIIAAVGGGAAVREGVGGLWRWLTGRQRRERDAIRQAYADTQAANRALLKAYADIDSLNQAHTLTRQAKNEWMDYAYTLRRIIIANGAQHLLPPLPNPGYTSVIEPTHKPPGGPNV